MAHSPISLSNATQKPDGANKPSSKISSGSQARLQGSFASVMAQEQGKSAGSQVATAASAAKKAPQVARLPEVGLPLRNTVLAGRSPSDMLRMQAYSQGSAGLRKSKAIEGFLKNNPSASTLDIARSQGAAGNLRTLAAGGNGAGFALTSSDFIHTSRAAKSSATSKTRSRQGRSTEELGIGKLSARFESGGDGIAAIGYDRTGGTSYGKYQIASKVGSMSSFLSFLDSEAPDLSKRLRQAGPANTGSRGGKMPAEWKAIAKEQPERFEQLQEAYIHKTHYKPALDAIEQRTGLDSSSLSAAMREVIWSTAVQHGPAGATRIFAQADNMSGSSDSASYERKLISNVYNLRAGQFGSSTSQVRDAVRSRFRQEKQMALNMLENSNKATMA